MGSGKDGNSSDSNSTEKNDDRQEQVKVEDNAAATAIASITNKRSYECTFCKRGFTNAQALGGHMNIHRKDRTKTKQLTPAASSSTSPKPSHLEYNNTNPNFTCCVSDERPVNYYPVIETRRNYAVYFQPASPNHHQLQQISHENIDQNGVQFRGTQSDEQLWGENLSLGVGSNHNLEDKIEVNTKEDELDLELRLGHDGYRLD